MEYSVINFLADALVILVIVLCAWIGKKRGFIKTFFGFFGSLISLVLSSLLTGPVGNFLAQKAFLPVVKRVVFESASKALGKSTESIGAEEILSAGDSFFSQFNVDAQSVSEYVYDLGEVGNQTIDSIAEYIASPIADAAGYATAFVLLFIIFAILIRIVVKVLDLVSHLPFLNFSNRFLGLGVGALWGILIAVLLSTALMIGAPSIQGIENEFFSSFAPEKTIIIHFFNKLNFLNFFVR